jgi:hypothetical protein
MRILLPKTSESQSLTIDRESHIGRLDKALDFGLENNWLIVDMAKDWKVIYSFQAQEQTPQ